MLVLLFAVVPVVVLLARTRFWWLPGMVIASCALPVTGYILGGARGGTSFEHVAEGIFSPMTALFVGGATLALGLGVVVAAGVMHRMMVKRDTVTLVSQQTSPRASQPR